MYEIFEISRFQTQMCPQDPTVCTQYTVCMYTVYRYYWVYRIMAWVFIMYMCVGTLSWLNTCQVWKHASSAHRVQHETPLCGHNLREFCLSLSSVLACSMLVWFWELDRESAAASLSSLLYQHHMAFEVLALRFWVQTTWRSKFVNILCLLPHFLVLPCALIIPYPGTGRHLSIGLRTWDNSRNQYVHSGFPHSKAWITCAYDAAW